MVQITVNHDDHLSLVEEASTMPAVKGHAYVWVTLLSGHQSFFGFGIFSSRSLNRMMHMLNGNGTLVNPLDLSKSLVFEYLRNANLLPLIGLRRAEIVYADAGSEVDRLLQCQPVTTLIGEIWVPTVYVLEFLTKYLSLNYDSNVDLINVGFVTVSRFIHGDLVGYIDADSLIGLGESNCQGFSMLLAANWNRLMHSINGNIRAFARRCLRFMKFVFFVASICWFVAIGIYYFYGNLCLILIPGSPAANQFYDLVLEMVPYAKLWLVALIIHIVLLVIINHFSDWRFYYYLRSVGFTNGVDLLLKFNGLGQFSVVERSSVTDPKKAVEFAGLIPRVFFETFVNSNGSIRGFNNHVLSRFMDVQTFSCLENVKDFYPQDYQLLLTHFTVRKNPLSIYMWDLQDTKQTQFINAIPLLSMVVATKGDGWECRKILEAQDAGQLALASNLFSTAISFRNGEDDHRLPENAHDMYKERIPKLTVICQLKVPKISNSILFNKKLGMVLKPASTGVFKKKLDDPLFIPFPIFMRFYLTHDQLYETLMTRYCSLEVPIPHNQVMLDVRRNTFYNFGMELLRIQNDMPVLLESVRKIRVENALYENKALTLDPQPSAPLGF